MSQPHYFILILSATAVLGVFLAVHVGLRRTGPGAWPLVMLSLAAALWSAAYALELASPGLAAKVLWAKVQYIGIVTVAPAWFVFAMQITARRSGFARSLRNLAAVAIIPITTLVLVWTNEAHGLVWSRTGLAANTPFPMLEVDYGPWFWVYWVFAYLLLMLGSIWLGSMLLQSTRLYRWQIGAASVGMLVPWIANLLYVAGLTPTNLDLTPFAFFVAAVAYYWSFFRLHLLDIVPVARRVVVDGLADCIVVCDTRNRIVDANPAAQRLVGKRVQDLVGQPAAGILGEHAGLIEGSAPEQPVRAEVITTVADAERSFDARITPLLGPRNQISGRLVVLHDITDHKRAQARLQQTQVDLERIVSQRTAALKEANRQLRDELVRRLQAESQFQGFFETASDALIVVDQEGRITLANARAEVLFGYSRDELCDEPIGTLIPFRFRDRHLERQAGYFSEPRVRPMGVGLDLWARRRDGGEFPAEITLSPLDTENGLRVVAAVRDISWRRRAEEALRESEAKFRAIVESSPIGMHIYQLETDGTLSLMEANPAADQILGVVHASHIGKTIEAAFPEVVGTDLPEQFRRVAANGGTWSTDRFPDDRDATLGALEVRAFQTSPGRMVAAFSDVTERMLAQEEQARLLAEIGQQQEELRALTRRLSEAQEAERKELARELHDRVGQNLTALDLNLNMIRSLMPGDLPACERIRPRVDASLDLLAQTAERIRDVMANLRPPVLDDYGLVAALDWYGREYIAPCGIAFSVCGPEPEPRLVPVTELALFRIAQEALTNVVKHARARNVTVSVETDGQVGLVRLTIADDGVGFEPSGQTSLTGRGQWGAILMGERARSVGGQCRLDSQPGQGTWVIVEVPR